MKRNLSPDKYKIAEPVGISVGTVWPTFHYMHLQSSDVIDGKQWPFMNFRMEEPLTPTRTRMWSWFMVDKSADDAFKKRSMEAYVRTFGPAGIFDQDDMENWEDCTRSNSARRPSGTPCTTAWAFTASDHRLAWAGYGV